MAMDMWIGDVWGITLLSLAMLVGCYVAGSIPLAISLSEQRLKLVTVMGAGLLVGTALAVIIPEGVHSLYSAQTEKHHAKMIESVGPRAVKVVNTSKDFHFHMHEHHDEHGELHQYIGVSLVLGFVFMLLVDQIGGAHGHSHTPDPEGSTPTKQNRNKITATLGLVVHAAADGVALGAAASTARADVELIVFIAIMLHKAPAAFGLVSFLMHEGFDRNRIRKHLLIFSLAAPLMTIITYFGLGQSGKEALSSVNATGITMLFSAGTFLYVATVHVLPEIQSMGTQAGGEGGGDGGHHHGFSKLELVAFVTGALFPLLLSVGHKH
ncbi:zinc transporter ZIP9-like [Branchiostoma lanceolatum]|uniref:SLC39A7 protein n=1 Tax=Branchiostoma lanceolatum TaxID=7740 RepID=A0A8J9ZTN3_BRALA|nr:SLC39A7 [Branchiostoma lanceolatum]